MHWGVKITVEKMGEDVLLSPLEKKERVPRRQHSEREVIQSRWMRFHTGHKLGGAGLWGMKQKTEEKNREKKIR